MQGYIHSIESFGTVDGPGVRYVVFFQGCPMRCQYCHNPDTWKMEDGKRTEASEIIANFERNRPFYTTGGITATGGEPLMQLEFLTELFTLARGRGISTCLDTSGILFSGEDERQQEKFRRLVKVTDLVMLDIKHMNQEAHKNLTGHSLHNVLAFAGFLARQKVPVWIRHVVVPGITDNEADLKALGSFIDGLPNFEKLEILPYHAMGKVKYDNLNIPYPLGDTLQLSKEEAKRAEEIVLSMLHRRGKE